MEVLPCRPHVTSGPACPRHGSDAVLTMDHEPQEDPVLAASGPRLEGRGAPRGEGPRVPALPRGQVPTRRRGGDLPDHGRAFRLAGDIRRGVGRAGGTCRTSTATQTSPSPIPRGRSTAVPPVRHTSRAASRGYAGSDQPRAGHRSHRVQRPAAGGAFRLPDAVAPATVLSSSRSTSTCSSISSSRSTSAMVSSGSE